MLSTYHRDPSVRQSVGVPLPIVIYTQKCRIPIERVQMLVTLSIISQGFRILLVLNYSGTLSVLPFSRFSSLADTQNLDVQVHFNRILTNLVATRLLVNEPLETFSVKAAIIPLFFLKLGFWNSKSRLVVSDRFDHPGFSSES